MTTLPTISESATGPTVEWAQYLLVRRTLSYNQIGGIFGPLTKIAVEHFQRNSHLAVDGVIGPATWAALGGDGAQPPILACGSQGPLVAQLQIALNEGRGDFAPASAPALAVDGSYGEQTTAMVTGMQQLAGIDANGVVGLQTWALPVHVAGLVLADLCGVRGPGAGHASGLPSSAAKWAESVGTVASPVLAGFSFTTIIVVAADAGKFRWADAAIISLTLATVTLIAAVQSSKYVREDDPSAARWYGWTRIIYHTGILALLLGLGFVLAPLHAAGSLDAPRWVACATAFAVAASEAIAFVRVFLRDAVRKVIKR